MKLNIKDLLDFFDDQVDSKKGDANAIISMMGEELNAAVYKHFRNNEVKLLDDPVTQGTKRGHRLDRWIVDGSQLLQCEIKNWAATAIGGARLRSDANDDEIKKIVEHYWKGQLKTDLSGEKEHPNGVTKVLIPMKRPAGYETFKINPLLIYWMPISSDERGLNPLSIIAVKTLNLPNEMNKFLDLYVFSVSLYLRQIYQKGKGSSLIDLDLPNFMRRIEILDKLHK